MRRRKLSLEQQVRAVMAREQISLDQALLKMQLSYEDLAKTGKSFRPCALFSKLSPWTITEIKRRAQNEHVVDICRSMNVSMAAVTKYCCLRHIDLFTADGWAQSFKRRNNLGRPRKGTRPSRTHVTSTVVEEVQRRIGAGEYLRDVCAQMNIAPASLRGACKRMGIALWSPATKQANYLRRHRRRRKRK